MSHFYDNTVGGGGAQGLLDILDDTDVYALPVSAFDLGHGWSLDIPHIINDTVYLSGGATGRAFIGLATRA